MENLEIKIYKNNNNKLSVQKIDRDSKTKQNNGNHPAKTTKKKQTMKAKTLAGTRGLQEKKSKQKQVLQRVGDK